MLNRTPPLLLVCFAGLALLYGCSPSDHAEYRPEFVDAPLSDRQTYRFGVHPLHNPKRLSQVFSPLMDYLNEQIPSAHFVLEASRDYPAYDAKLDERLHDFSLPNPYQTLRAVDVGYRVFAKMGDDHNFRGIILLRRDSMIERVTDLKGEAVSYPAPTALAATMMPQAFLQQNGIDVMSELDNRYVGSQESSIMNAFLGQTAAAATWPPPWRALKAERPELAEQMIVKWRTEPLINNGVVAHPAVPERLVERVKALLIELHGHERGRTILRRMELSRFEPASDATYEVIRDFLAEFSEEVRDLN